MDAREAAVSVLVNGKVVGETGTNGVFQSSLPTGEYRVAVQKQGFGQPAQQSVRIARDAVRQVAFRLEPKPAELVVADALAGTQILADGRLIGSASGASTVVTVPPGAHNIELRKDGYTARQFALRFEPGGRTTIAARDAQLTRVPAAPEVKQPPRQDPRPDPAIEAAAAKAAVEAAAAAEARRLELTDWEGARARPDHAAIEAFLAKHPRSGHRDEAEKLLVQIERERQEKARADTARFEQAEREKADAQGIAQALARLTGAYGTKDVNEISRVYPSISKQFLASLRRDIDSLTWQLKTVGTPQVTGDTAIVQVDRSVATRFKGESKPKTESDRVAIALRRVGPVWIIESIR